MLDAIVIAGVDVTFELIHRRGTTNTTIAAWTMHFNPLPASFDAQPYETDQLGIAVPFASGDKLVFKFSADNTIQSDAWIPNGDGKISHGRVPNFTLPK